MIVACAAEVRGRCLWEDDTSNKPFEWTGHHKLLATPPQASCLPLKGSVRRFGKRESENALRCMPKCWHELTPQANGESSTPSPAVIPAVSW
jgi:hypothetical protein